MLRNEANDDHNDIALNLYSYVTLTVYTTKWGNNSKSDFYVVLIVNFTVIITIIITITITTTIIITITTIIIITIIIMITNTISITLIIIIIKR